MGTLYTIYIDVKSCKCIGAVILGLPMLAGL